MILLFGHTCKENVKCLYQLSAQNICGVFWTSCSRNNFVFMKVPGKKCLFSTFSFSVCCIEKLTVLVIPIAQTL
jgi:hypothetical protein